MMRQITPQEFLLGVEQGHVTECFAVVKRIYGKDQRGYVCGVRQFEVVYADVP